MRPAGRRLNAPRPARPPAGHSRVGMVTPSRTRRRAEAQRGRAGRADGTMTRRRRADARRRRRAKGGGNGLGPRGSRNETCNSRQGRPSSAPDEALGVPRPDVITSPPLKPPPPHRAAELRPGAENSGSRRQVGGAEGMGWEDLGRTAHARTTSGFLLLNPSEFSNIRFH